MLKTIEIDIDVYKMIEAERKSFEETQNEILRRMLGIEKNADGEGYWIKAPDKMLLKLEERENDEDDEKQALLRSLATMRNFKYAPDHESPIEIFAPANNDWIFEGVRLTEGTKLRKWYRGQQYYAVIANGGISFGDTLYHAPSAAAMAITNGSPVNGWLFWEFFDEQDGAWKKLAELRGEVQKPVDGSSIQEETMEDNDSAKEKTEDADETEIKSNPGEVKTIARKPALKKIRTVKSKSKTSGAATAKTKTPTKRRS